MGFDFISGMEKVFFSLFASQRQHFNVQDTVDSLINKLSSALKVNPGDCQFIHCEEVVSNWFNLTLELPKRKEVLDQLCFDALNKALWLAQCGVTAVKIGDKSEIHLQSLITPSVLASLTPGADLPCTEGKMLLLKVAYSTYQQPVLLEIHVTENLEKFGGGVLLNVRDGRAGEKKRNCVRRRTDFNRAVILEAAIYSISFW